MLKDAFSRVYSGLKINFYKSIFAKLKEREGSLSATEAFSLDVIALLGRPTVSQFARFINVPQSNATYKISCLIKKGYIKKFNNEDDKREFYLELTDKYYNYARPEKDYITTVMDRVETNFPKEQVEIFKNILKKIGSDFMPEVQIKENCNE